LEVLNADALFEEKIRPSVVDSNREQASDRLRRMVPFTTSVQTSTLWQVD
jgi:hypothetical protein